MAINWVDRVATHPGRVQLTPVQGQTNIYDMERADEPTVAGTPVNAANLNAMQKNMGLDANMTVYVAVSGSDATGNGSRTAPYQTITKALSAIPRQLNGYTATVYIESGTYPEKLNINGFTGGTLMFTGVTNSAISVTSIAAVTTDMLIFRNLNFSVVGGSDVLYGVHVTGGSLVVDTGSFSISNASNTGMYAILGATAYFTNLSISAGANAINVSNGAQIIVGTLTGSVTETGFRATGGGRITFGSSTLAARTLYVTSSGGRILTGSQTSIPNY